MAKPTTKAQSSAAAGKKRPTAAKPRAKRKAKPTIPTKRDLFVKFYVETRNAGEAARRAGYSERGAYTEGHRLLKNADVARKIAKELNGLAERTEISQDRVLKRWWDQATADANDVVQHRHGACRYCYGQNHEYQWKTEREWREAYDAAAVKVLDRIAAVSESPEIFEDDRGQIIARTFEDPSLPTNDGGFGYRIQDAPNPDCPECGGEGVPYTHIVDSRELSGAALSIYDGVKETRQGVEVKLVDRSAALEKVAKHLGMFKDAEEINANSAFMRAMAAFMDRAGTLEPGKMDMSRLDDGEEAG